MKLKEIIARHEIALIRFVNANEPEKACRLTFTERNIITDACSVLLGDFEDLGVSNSTRHYRYFKQVYFFEEGEEWPVRIEVIFPKNTNKNKA